MPALLETNLNISAGATFNSDSYEWTNADSSLKNLAGWTGRLQIRTSPTAATAAVDIVPTIDVPSACVSFTIPAATTSTLTGGPYVWALELYAPTADPVVRFLEGRVFVSPEVVR